MVKNLLKYLCVQLTCFFFFQCIVFNFKMLLFVFSNLVLLLESESLTCPSINGGSQWNRGTTFMISDYNLFPFTRYMQWENSEEKEKKKAKRKKKKKTWNEEKIALRIQYVWQKKYPPEPENCHRVAVISVSNSFQLWITRPISRAPCTQQPFTVTRQSSNSENKDHMSSSLRSSSLPVYAALARTARSLM